MNGRRVLWSVMALVTAMVLWSFVRTQAGLVGRWPFDEGSGTNTVDVSGVGTTYL